MSVVPAGKDLPAIPDEDTGLEDFDQSDFVTPTIKINHTEAVFEDGLSGEQFDVLDGILLGLIKQRILWDPEVSDDAKPLCKSWDFLYGHPSDDFPWDPSGFDPDTPTPLDCSRCPLKDWGTHPRNKTPWCSEQHTLPILRITAGGSLSPALLTVQRSAIKPSKAYLSGFAASGTPAYTVQTKIELQANKRGTVNYAVPRFVKGVATDPDNWPEFASSYRSMREFVRTPRLPDAETETESTPTPTPAARPTATGRSRPAAAPAAPPADKSGKPFDEAPLSDDDELPWS